MGPHQVPGSVLRLGTQSGGDSTPHKCPCGERCREALREGRRPVLDNGQESPPSGGDRELGLERRRVWGEVGTRFVSLEGEPAPAKPSGGPEVSLSVLRKAMELWDPGRFVLEGSPRLLCRELASSGWMRVRAGARSQRRRGKCSDRTGSRGHEKGQCLAWFWRDEVKK